MGRNARLGSASFLTTCVPGLQWPDDHVGRNARLGSASFLTEAFRALALDFQRQVVMPVWAVPLF